VALLEEGGRPLLSPPNWPHLVITLQDCVMIETRKICKLFLDEVAYFMQRAKLWRDPPILYPFITSVLQTTEGMQNIERFLLERIGDSSHDNDTSRDILHEGEVDEIPAFIKQRALASLKVHVSKTPTCPFITAMWFKSACQGTELAVEESPIQQSILVL
jgi:hypothetical protein